MDDVAGAAFTCVAILETVNVEVLRLCGRLPLRVPARTGGGCESDRRNLWPAEPHAPPLPHHSTRKASPQVTHLHQQHSLDDSREPAPPIVKNGTPRSSPPIQRTDSVSFLLCRSFHPCGSSRQLRRTIPKSWQQVSTGRRAERSR